MAKITETGPRERVFTLEVNKAELQLIARGLYKDKTKPVPALPWDNDENNDLYGVVSDFMCDNDVEEKA